MKVGRWWGISRVYSTDLNSQKSPGVPSQAQLHDSLWVLIEKGVCQHQWSSQQLPCLLEPPSEAFQHQGGGPISGLYGPRPGPNEWAAALKGVRQQQDTLRRVEKALINSRTLQVPSDPRRRPFTKIMMWLWD